MGRRIGIKRHRWSVDDDACLMAVVEKLNEVGYLDTLLTQGGPRSQGRYWDAVAGVLAVDHGIQVTGSSVGNRLNKIGRAVPDATVDSEVVTTDVNGALVEGFRLVVENQTQVGDGLVGLTKGMSDLSHIFDEGTGGLIESMGAQLAAVSLMQEGMIALLMKVDRICVELSIPIVPVKGNDRRAQ